MIQLSARGKAIYQLLHLIVALLPLYGAGILASASFQFPSQPLVNLIEAGLIERVAERALRLTVLSGLFCAGFMLAGERLSPRAVLWLQRAWTALVIIAFALSPFELAGALDLAAALMLLAIAAASFRRREASVILRVWQLGLLLTALCLAVEPWLNGRALEAAGAFRLQVACPLASLALMFWLMRRYSRVDAAWADDGLRIVALLVLLAGGMISLGRVGLPALVSLPATPLVAISYIILAGRSHRALSSRNENASLAPHWIALATLFWLVGGGFLGALSIQPAIGAAIRGTDMATAQDWLAGWVLLAITLAFVNECAASLRGDNRRVTGYAPLWLVAFGAGLASIVLVCRGVVQITLRDIAAMEAADLPALLLPLTVVWLVCLSAVAGGCAFYALGYWLRRPRIRVVEA